MRFSLLVLAGGFALFAIWPALTHASEPAEIVFESGGRVMSMDANGEGRENLIAWKQSETGFFTDTEVAPEISPDGTQLAYLDDFEPEKGRSFDRLVVADRDGNNRKTVLTTRSSADDHQFTGFSWAPDNRLYVSIYKAYPKSIVTWIASVELDGTRRVELSRAFGYRKGSLQRGAYIFDVDAAPDGRHLLVGSYDSSVLNPQIEIFDLETGKSRVIRRRAEKGAFSPDGSRILFQSDRTKVGRVCSRSRCRGATKLFVMKSDGSGVRRLTRSNAAGDETGGAWSPDGSRIAFAGNRNDPTSLEDGNEIYTVKRDGSCLTWLTNGTPAALNPSWGPETDREPAPETCGQRNRKPAIDLVPDLHPIVNGDPVAWPRLWLGPVYSTLGQSSTDSEGRSLLYSDCTRFNVADCGDVAFAVDSDDVCLGWAEMLAWAGDVKRATMIRGALAILPSGRDATESESLVLTGGQAVMISNYRLRKGARLPVSAQARAIRQLRPVGESDSSSDLEPPVINRQLPVIAARYAAAVRKAGSVAAAARKLNGRQSVVRSWLKIHRILLKFGPFETVSCKGWL